METSEKKQRARVCEIDRNQLVMRTVDIERLVEWDHPVRGIWELVGSFDLSCFYQEIESIEGKAGRPAHDPQLLICLWVYSYSIGLVSAREIARRCDHEPAYQWLTGLTWVNAHTLSDFRVKHSEAVDQLAAQVLGVLSTEGLVQLRRVVHDGTKVRANAGADSFRRERRLQQHIEWAREQIEGLEREAGEEGESERVRAARERAVRERKKRLESAVEQLQEIRKHSEKAPEECRASWTDPECRVMKQSNGGYGPSYNVQISTDADGGVIVAAGISQAASDQGLLTEGIDRISDKAGRLPKQVVIDGGFIKGEAIEAVEARGVEVIGPAEEEGKSAEPEKTGISSKFTLEAFRYVAEKNVFICPAGKTLSYVGQENRRGGQIRYRYQAQAQDCQNCPFKRECCPKARKGRLVMRQVSSRALASFREKMRTEQAKEIYRIRGAVAEFSNLWIKTKNGLQRFSVRGLAKVSTEIIWVCLTYNIQLWLRKRWRVRLAIPSGA